MPRLSFAWKRNKLLISEHNQRLLKWKFKKSAKNNLKIARFNFIIWIALKHILNLSEEQWGDLFSDIDPNSFDDAFLVHILCHFGSVIVINILRNFHLFLETGDETCPTVSAPLLAANPVLPVVAGLGTNVTKTIVENLRSSSLTSNVSELWLFAGFWRMYRPVYNLKATSWNDCEENSLEKCNYRHWLMICKRINCLSSSFQGFIFSSSLSNFYIRSVVMLWICVRTFIHFMICYCFGFALGWSFLSTTPINICRAGFVTNIRVSFNHQLWIPSLTENKIQLGGCHHVVDLRLSFLRLNAEFKQCARFCKIL